MEFEDKFTKSCTPFKVRQCEVHRQFLDPCSCTKYFECDVGDNVLERSCAGGTAFNHTGGFNRCVTEREVYAGDICNTQTPWERCNVSDERMTELHQLCRPTDFTTVRLHVQTQTTYVRTEGTVTIRTSHRPENSTTGTRLLSPVTQTIVNDESMRVYLGYIVGGVIAFLFLTFLLVLFCVNYRRKTLKRRMRLSKRRLVLNPEYNSTSGTMTSLDEDDVYTVIYDRIVPWSHTVKAQSGNAPALPVRPMSIHNQGQRLSNSLVYLPEQTFGEESMQSNQRTDNNPVAISKTIDSTELNSGYSRIYKVPLNHSVTQLDKHGASTINHNVVSHLQILPANHLISEESPLRQPTNQNTPRYLTIQYIEIGKSKQNGPAEDRGAMPDNNNKVHRDNVMANVGKNVDATTNMVQSVDNGVHDNVMIINSDNHLLEECST